MHWILDVTFREDDGSVRKGHAAHNLSAIRKFAFRLCARIHSIQSAAYAVAGNSPIAALIIALNSLGSRRSDELRIIRMTFM